MSQNTTCACNECFSDEVFNTGSSCTWQQHILLSNVTEKACDSVCRVHRAEVPNETLLAEVVKEVEVPSVNVVQGCFAVVLYD